MNDAAVALTLGYVAIGGLVAATLHRKGHARDTVGVALLGWPLLVHLLLEQASEVDKVGPLASAIRQAFAAMHDLLARTGQPAPVWLADLDGLQAALQATDERLAVVDRILCEADLEDAPPHALVASLDSLRAHRKRTADEVLRAIEELARMRVQIGIVALSGDTLPVREGLRSLTARVRAAQELTDLTESA